MPGEWDEDQHPRDDHGRFGSGGGGSELKDWASKKAGGGAGAVPHEGAPRASDPGKGADGLRLTPERKWTDERPKGMAPQTWMTHFSGRPAVDASAEHPDGKPSTLKANAERKARVHDPIVKAAFKGLSPAKPGEQKIAVMTMGGPASGKSSMMRGKDTGMVKVDPDHVKGQLPEYRQAIRPEATFKGAAAMVHEESSYVARRVRDEAIKGGYHVLIDGTGGNAKKFLETMRELKNKGYEVHVHMPHLGVDEGLKRAESRANKTGRLVPESFARKTYTAIDRNVEKIMREADNFHLYNAASRDPPTKMWEKIGGKEKVVDASSYNAFQGRKRL